MSKINETIVMMAEHAEVFKIGDRNFQIIEVKEAEEQPDYSHLVGKWVKCLHVGFSKAFTVDKWYKCVGIDEEDFAPKFIDDSGVENGFMLSSTPTFFDLSNPSDTNPDEKPLWEKANEAMWRIDSMASFDLSYATEDFREQFQKEWKHIRAYLFLSKFADLCNEGRVVDWNSDSQDKHAVAKHRGKLHGDYCKNIKRHIAFLDKKARDYSLKVHEHIWKDYWGIKP